MGDSDEARTTHRCVRIAASGSGRAAPFDHALLSHDERRVRRAVLTLSRGDRVALDLPDATTLHHGSRLVLEDGREAEVVAAREDLLQIDDAGSRSLAELAWHLGNRHTPAQIEAERILVARDDVLARMLEGLGATVREVTEPFEPLRGAYHSHGRHAH